MSTLADALHAAAQRTPDRVLIVDGDVELDAQTLQQQAGALAAALLITPVPLAAQQAPPNTLTQAERDAGWRLLFDGTTTDGWRGYQMTTMPTGWQAKDGALTRVGAAADIVVLDLRGISVPSSISNPHQLSRGVRQVLVNGRMAFDNGAFTGTLAGQVLGR